MHDKNKNRRKPRLATVLAALSVAFATQGAFGQAKWPDFMPTLMPDFSASPVIAQLPADVKIEAPAASVPAERARWSGQWAGWACRAAACSVNLAVEKISSEGATIVYAFASSSEKSARRLEAQFRGEELQASLAPDTTIAFRLRPSGDVEFFGSKDKQWMAGILSKDSTGSSFQRFVDRVPTKFLEDGKPVTLEVVVFKPAGAAPFPALMFNHGSTGTGQNKAAYRLTYTNESIVRFFTDRGWLVAFPQRRGRGQSDGLYDEGFRPDRSAYSSIAAESLPGVDRALADLDAVVEYLHARGDVDAKRMLIGGQSRGGILAVAHAGARPQTYIGVVNFVGGWMGQGSKDHVHINHGTFSRGADFRYSTFWAYGEGDTFYSMAHSRSNFAAFEAAGGKGMFHAYHLGKGVDGHGLLGFRDAWRDDLDRYVRNLPR